MDRCWLKDVQRQIIGTLSKGYRQRVGLADALLADPPVLILDEPTAGLDPSQIHETRNLILRLGQGTYDPCFRRTILPEVEMTCDRVIIISRGQVRAAASLAELVQVGGKRVLLAEFEGGVDPTPMRAVPGVDGVEVSPSRAALG